MKLSSLPGLLALGLALLQTLLAQTPADRPALRTVRSTDQGLELLTNGPLEDTQAGRVQAWHGWQQGFAVAEGQGRHTSRAVRCQRAEGEGEFGVGQTLTLNRCQVAPLVIRGWSRAENVSGSPDSGYSLYADLIYMDGTPLWGQHIPFSCGTHDWEARELLVLPDKPVRSITLHGLFRGHTGTVWFDDLSLREIQTPLGTFLYQGVPVQPPDRFEPGSKAARTTLRTRDDLHLGLQDQQVTALKIGDREFLPEGPSGFLVRDVASASDFYGFANGVCTALGLNLHVIGRAHNDHIVLEGRLQDTRGLDRAITLVFALPVEATGWQWGDDVRAERRLEGHEEYLNAVNMRAGANGKMSRYPLAAIWDARTGLALGLDMDRPAQSRLVYHAGLKQLLIAYDFGLSPVTASPGEAAFRFVIYRFDPRWGFRAALQKFHEIFPTHFARRVPREGVWMPFTDVAQVPAFEDFGFAFQEGAPNVAFDDQHDIASFVYVEPMSHWLPLPATAPRTYDGALAVLREDLAGQRTDDLRRMASATLSSGLHRSDGRFALHLQKAPWCDGGVVFLNPLPQIPTNAAWPWTKASVMNAQIDKAFAKHAVGTNPARAWSGLDGVYLDSLEMAAEEINYRRGHFVAGRVPLTFDREGAVGQLMIFNTWEFARAMADRMHAAGKLMFANGVLWNYSFPAPLLDVLGTEVNWMPQGTFQPDTDAVMNFRRALSGRKPYCLLMNTDFSRLDSPLVERYFQRCLFYGIWPGFFDQDAASKDPYWASAKRWYERDRGLFRKYIPLLRQVTEAGWRPVTGARCDNPHILLERFGPDPQGTLYVTLLNDTDAPQAGLVTCELEGLPREPARREVRALVADAEVTARAEAWPIELAPLRTEVLAFRSSRP